MEAAREFMTLMRASEPLVASRHLHEQGNHPVRVEDVKTLFRDLAGESVEWESLQGSSEEAMAVQAKTLEAINAARAMARRETEKSNRKRKPKKAMQQPQEGVDLEGQRVVLHEERSRCCRRANGCCRALAPNTDIARKVKRLDILTGGIFKLKTEEDLLEVSVDDWAMR